jgi:hypothetical protein
VTNGNTKQAKEYFNMLDDDEKKDFIDYVFDFYHGSKTDLIKDVIRSIV